LRLELRFVSDGPSTPRPQLHLLDLGGDIAGNGLSKLFLTIAAAFAEAERDRIRERITNVKQDRKARGRGLGELFIVRNAGNTVDIAALGSIEYAVAELGVPLIVVMGHERCGAVDAALTIVEKNTTFPGNIGRMVEPIIPAALKAKSSAPANIDRAELLDEAVRENVRRVVTRLRTATDPLLLEPLQAGKLKVVGAHYDLEQGRVDFFMEN